MTTYPRDRFSYSSPFTRPKLKLPGKGRIIVWSVVNIEEWEIERPMARQLSIAPQGKSAIPDMPNWTWYEYGMRVGFWRIKAAMDAHGIKPTLAINGAVPDAYPRVTQAARDAGWEFMVHGYHQTATHNVEDQRAMIRSAVDALEKAGGHKPVGWLAPGLTETLDTPDLLAEAVYGLPEVNREAIRGARVVANPGCYPTASLLALLPMKGRLADVIVDAKSGVSGAGKTPTPDVHYCSVADSVRAYKVLAHSFEISW